MKRVEVALGRSADLVPASTHSFARFVDDDLTIVVLTNTAQRPQSIQEIVGGIADRVLRQPAER